MALRACTRCNTEKPLTDFHMYSGKPLSKCKECGKQYQKELRKRNPESKEKRRRRYIKESLGSGMRYRVGLKYIFEMPTKTHGKCNECNQWKKLEWFRKDNSQPTSRPNYYRTTCMRCETNRRPPPQVRSPEEYPVVCPTCGKRFTKRTGMQSHHRKIHKVSALPLPKKQKPQKDPQAAKLELKGKNLIYQYLLGDGCCLYCWNIEPWKLNRHHVWGRKNNDFTITLCENHHAALSRHMPFLLRKWTA